MRRQIPHFESLEEESDFWDTADTTDFIDPNEPPIQIEFVGPQAEAAARRRRRRPVSIRLDEEMIYQLKEAAEARRIGYQTLMRMWVAERLAEEKAGRTPAEELAKAPPREATLAHA